MVENPMGRYVARPPDNVSPEAEWLGGSCGRSATVPRSLHRPSCRQKCHERWGRVPFFPSRHGCPKTRQPPKHRPVLERTSAVLAFGMPRQWKHEDAAIANIVAPAKFRMMDGRGGFKRLTRFSQSSGNIPQHPRAQPPLRKRIEQFQTRARGPACRLGEILQSPRDPRGGEKSGHGGPCRDPCRRASSRMVTLVKEA